MMWSGRIVYRAFCKYLREIWDDVIFAALMFLPPVLGLLFHYGIPALERELCEMQGVQEIIAPYYVAFDLCIIMMTPIMFAFSGVMVILGELDSKMAQYLMVTPLGRSGYLWSRIGIMSIISMIYGCVVTSFARLSDISIPHIFLQGVYAAMIGIFISFCVVALAHNKVEGVALTKFSAFFILGIPVSIFLKAPIKYLASFLPTFWSTEYELHGRISDALIGLGVGLVLIAISYRLFKKKVMK